MTKLTTTDLIAHAEDMGCQVEEQKSFYKITGPTENRKAVYVGRTKRVFTRIDASGFEVEGSEIVRTLSEADAKELNLGAVRAQILNKNLAEEVSDEEVLEAFSQFCHNLLDEEEGFKLGRKEETEEEELQVAADEG